MAELDADKFPLLAAFEARGQKKEPAPQQRGMIPAMISAGTDEFQASSAGLLTGLGDAIGSRSIADLGTSIRDRNELEAQQNGRPDLEGGIFDNGWAAAPQRAIYQAGKQLPQLGVSLLAARLFGPAAGRMVAEEGAAARFGASVPKFLGGGGLRAGANELERQAAMTAGREFVANRAAMAPVLYPQAVGSQYNEAADSGTRSPGNAAWALAGGVPYALMEGLEPGALQSFIKRGAAGNIGKRAITSMLGVAPTEAVTEGVQTAMEQSFRPDISPRDKANNIVQAMITGGVVGGIFGGVAGGLSPRIKTIDAKDVTNDDMAALVDERLGVSKPQEANGQQVLPGMEARGPKRPFEDATDEQLQAQLAGLQQRTATDNRRDASQFVSSFMPDGSVERAGTKQDIVQAQLIQRELDRRAGILQEEPAPDFTTGTRTEITNFPVVGRAPNLEEGAGFTQGPFQSTTTYTPPTQQAAQEAPREPSPTVEQPTQTNLFGADRTALPYATRPTAGEDTSILSEEQVKAQQLTNTVIGDGKNMWQKTLREMPAADPVDVATNVMTAINTFDAGGKKAPEGLLTVGKNLGLLDSKGVARDLTAEVNAAEAQYETLWRRAQETGKGAGEATAFKKNTLTKLREAKATSDAIQKRLAERQANAKPAATSVMNETAPAPVPEDQRVSTLEESVDVLRGAPPVTPAPSFEQQFRQRGVAPQPGEAPVEAAPTTEVVTAVTPPPAAPVRDASGTQYQTLAQRFRAPVAPTQADVAPDAGPQARAGAALGLTTPSDTGMQVVTKKTRPPKTQKEAVAQRESARIPAPVKSPLAGGTSVGAANARVAEEAKARRDDVQKRLQFVANDTSVDEIGRRDIREAAAVAAKAHAEGRAGADIEADRVLAEHGVATGGTVFSTRRLSERTPPMSEADYDQALKAAASKLPVSARNVIISVNTAADLPSEVLTAAANANMHPSEIRGVLHDGKVYVVQDNVSSQAELQEVIDHELFGHGGARALLGDQRGAVLTRVWDMAGGLEGLRSLARYFGVERQLNGYLPGRDLTSADKIALTDELIAQVAGKATGKWKTFLMAWASRFKSALINTLDKMGLTTAAERLNTFTPVDMAEMIVRMREAAQSGGDISGRGTAFLRKTPDGMNETTQELSKIGDRVRDALENNNTAQTLSLEGNKFNLYTSTVTHISKFYEKMFQIKDAAGNVVNNALQMYFNANRARQNTEQRLAHLSKRALASYEALQKFAPKMAERVEKLMGYTYFNIDPRKSWDDQPWLHGLRNADVLKKHATEANTLYRQLVQVANQPANKGKISALSVYSDFIHINETFHYAQQAVSLYNILATDEGVLQEFKDQVKNPMDVFLAAGNAYDAPADARNFWVEATNNLAAQAKTYVETQRGITGRDETTQAQIARGTSAIDARLGSITSEQEAMKRSPYFHIGRFGNHVLRFDIKGEKGVADPAAIERIAKVMEDNGVKGIEFPEGTERANAYIRFEKVTDRNAAFKVAQQLEKEGLISDVQHEDRRDSSFGTSVKNAPMWAQRLMDHMRTSPLGGKFDMPGVEPKLLEAMNAEFERNVQQFFLNMLPDIAVNKVMVHRNSVPGFSSDMVRSFVFRTQVGGRALANVYASAKMSDATAQMLQIAKDARKGDSPKEAQIKANVVTELFKREAQRPLVVKNDYIDTMRAMNHAYFLGLAPAHFIINTTQVGVLLWPELSKKYSFVKSAQAIAKVTPLAFKVIKATLADALSKGVKHIPDASITHEALTKAGVDTKTADFIMRVVNSGLLDIGSQSRELGRIAEGQGDSAMEKTLQWASSTGYYSEMLSRLIAALSARELHGDGAGLDEYVDETVQQSMLGYETWNQARAVGRMGMAGQFTPIMTSFMQYQFQVTEKLIRELAHAFGMRGATAAEKKAGRDFLVAHMAAVTTVAGTLGLPAAAIFAAVFDRMKDLYDPEEEPSDIQAAYRGWLANMIGKDAAEVVARGLPHAIPFGGAVDISQRAGEQNFLPFGHMMQKLLTDRREWKDKTKDWALDTLGSPVGMVSNIYTAGEKMLKGDFKGAMSEGLPLAFRGPAKAFYMTSDGYSDSKGNKLPMDPSAGAVLAQALGFNPAPKAEYAEARNTQQVLRGQLLRRAQDLRNKLIRSLEQGDMDAAREYYAKAAQFGIDNPSFQILPTLASTISSRKKADAMARATNSPLGVKPELVNRTSWANIGN